MRTFLDRYLRDFPREGEGAGGGAAGDAGGGDKGDAGGGDKGGGGAGDKGGGGAGDKGGGDPWFKPFNLDQKATDYLGAKGVKDLGGLIKVAQDFETVARDRNVIAKPDPKSEKFGEWEGHELLGWVKDPTKYQPKEPTPKEGQVYDKDMFSHFVKLAHAERLPVAAVERIYQGMFDNMQERIATVEQAAATKAKNDAAALDKALHDDWGPEYGKKSEASKRAWRALGIGKEQSAELEKIMGSPALVKLGAKIGDMLGEDTLKGLGDGAGSAGDMTPEQARAEQLKLEGDAEWMKVFNDPRHPQQAQYAEQRQRLIRLQLPRNQRAA